MKKIVALVLAMVMVLGLATTAFAAKMGEDLTAALKDTGWDYNVEIDDAEDAKDETFATYEIEAVAKKDDAVMWWASQTDVEKGDDFDVPGVFVKVANPELADVVMVDGKVVTYFMAIDDETTWDGKATKVTLAALPVDVADQECNTLYAPTTAAPQTLYFFDDTLWVADEDGETVLNVDGVAVYVSVADWEDDLTYTGHDYEVLVKEDHDNNDVVTKLYGQACKKEFKFVQAPEAVAVSVFCAGNYDDITVEGYDLFMELVVPANWPTASTSAPAVDGDKVESPKTFDAGIAMYVGMSVMAAAGSAVVLKKKD